MALSVSNTFFPLFTEGRWRRRRKYSKDGNYHYVQVWEPPIKDQFFIEYLKCPAEFAKFKRG